MRKWTFTLFTYMIMVQLWAQNDYYIYIQSEDGNSFYAKSGTKIIESSGNGYLVIPNLKGQNYEFIIGFPQQPGTEWKFNCATGENDQAYILRPGNKNKPVELSVLRQGKNITGTKVTTDLSKQHSGQDKKATGVVSDDPFSSMLALAVSDPSIKQQPVIISKPAEPEKTVIAAISKQPEPTKENKPQPKIDSAATAKDGKKDSTKTSVAVVDKQSEIKEENKIQPATDSGSIAKETRKDSAKTSVAVIDKQPEAKKEDTPQAKMDSNAIVKEIKKDSVKASITISDKQPETRKEDKTSITVDSSAIVKTEKKGTDSAGYVVLDTKTGGKEAAPIVAKTDSDATAKVQPPTTSVSPGTWVPVEKKLISIVKSANIKRTLQRKSNEGVELIYIDELTDGTKDTIRILIPASK